MPFAYDRPFSRKHKTLLHHTVYVLKQTSRVERDTHKVDFQPPLLHVVELRHSQLSEVFLHFQVSTVGGALNMFRPGQRKYYGGRVAQRMILSSQDKMHKKKHAVEEVQTSAASAKMR